MALKPYRATAHWKKIRLDVLRRDAYTCAYCGDVADQVDHVHPKAKGGEDTLDNLVAACKRCNYAKRDKTDTVFLITPSTPPALAGNFSPKSDIRDKSVRKSPTTVRVDADSPFLMPSEKGAS
jgi:5-methylcytosine-specific restriction endonuclease McrA